MSHANLIERLMSAASRSCKQAVSDPELAQRPEHVSHAALLREAAEALALGPRVTEVAEGHPWLVDRWTVGGDRPGEFALVHVFSPPNPDDNNRPHPLCARLTRARNDAEFVREGWLTHEREIVRRHREARS